MDKNTNNSSLDFLALLERINYIDKDTGNLIGLNEDINKKLKEVLQFISSEIDFDGSINVGELNIKIIFNGKKNISAEVYHDCYKDIE